MEMPNSHYKNLASVVLENGGTSADNTITISADNAAVFPATPFYATIMLTSVLANSSNSEIIYVSSSTTSGSNTIFSITRAQRGTSAVSWGAGEAVLTHAIYREDVEAQSQGYYNATLSSGTAFTITNNSAPTSPTLGNKIRVLFSAPVTTESSITLSINGGTTYTLASAGATYGTVGTVNTNLTISDDIVYDLIFTGNNWTIANAHSLVGSQDIDSDIPAIGQDLSTPTNVAYVATANIQDGAVTMDKLAGTVLWQASGSSGVQPTSANPISLSDSVSNYKRIEVTVSNNSTAGLGTETRVYRPEDTVWIVSMFHGLHNNVYYRYTQYEVTNGTSVAERGAAYQGQATLTTGPAITFQNGADGVYLWKIIGYK